MQQYQYKKRSSDSSNDDELFPKRLAYQPAAHAWNSSPHDNAQPTLGFNSFKGEGVMGEYGYELFIGAQPPAPERRRAASSLVSDISDRQPYVRPRSPSTDAEEHNGNPAQSSAVPPAMRPGQHLSRSTATPAPGFGHAAPFATMRPDFHISSPDPATIRPFPMTEQDAALVKPRRQPNAAKHAQNIVDGDGDHEYQNGDAQGGGRNPSADFFNLYGQLLGGHTHQTTILDHLHEAHLTSMKRTQNLASRRKQRIEQLERENISLRTHLSQYTATSHPTSNSTPNTPTTEQKLTTSLLTIEMLTKDLNDWERKYMTSQAALRSATDDSLTFERKYSSTSTELATTKQELAETKGKLEEANVGIRQGTKQLKALQKMLRKIDRVVVGRVKELARLSGEWDAMGGGQGGHGGNENLRAKVAGEMTELVNAWRRFEGEYDEGLGPGDA